MRKQSYYLIKLCGGTATKSTATIQMTKMTLLSGEI